MAKAKKELSPLGKQIQVVASQKYLSYLALNEVMLTHYEDCKFLKMYDPNLTLKHKNLIVALKREASAAWKFIQSGDDSDESITQFHDFTLIHEALHDLMDKGGEEHFNKIREIKSILKL
jgi:hypothetical protein